MKIRNIKKNIVKTLRTSFDTISFIDFGIALELFPIFIMIFVLTVIYHNW